MQRELDQVNEEIESTTRVLSRTPNVDPNIRPLLIGLALAHDKRFNLRQDSDDIHKAIEYRSSALTLTPDSDSGLPDLLSRLGTAHSKRFQRLGNKNDLEKAIEYQYLSLNLIPEDDPDMPRRLTNLAATHKDRFQQLGEVEDIEKAIECNLQAVALTPQDHPRLPDWLEGLGTSYSYRFRRFGELKDIESAIEYRSRALALTPEDDPGLPSCLINLAVSHNHRFQHVGEISDMDQAIKYQYRELSDLEQAIDYQSRALAATPDDHPHLPNRLSNLALSYSGRFEHLGEPSDLEQAIGHGSRALALTPDDHPELPTRLANLAVSHKRRFLHLNKLSELKRAIEYESRALVAIPQDRPESCLWRSNHANSYVSYYDHSHDPLHLQQSLLLFRSACVSSSGRPRDRFKIASGWAFHASEHSALCPIEAYQVTIDLLPQFIWLGATADQRFQDLKSIETLAVDAAHAAIVSSNFSLALEWLEHARCIVWSQNLMLRSPLDQLLESHPILASSLQNVADQLQTAVLNSRESQAFYRSITSEQVAQDHRRLAQEYEQLMAQARIQPGFEDFLRPMKAAGLMRATRNGPIVVINCHEDRCDALLVLPGQPTVAHLPLPSFDGKKARDARSTVRASLRRKGIRQRGVHVRQESGRQNDIGSVLALLWTDVVKQILEVLGFTAGGAVQSLPHITWCPTGSASFLPFHAAGDYDQPHSRVFDYAISSYTPTLTALLGTYPGTLSRDSEVLAVEQAATPGRSPLPGTMTELKYVRSHVESRAGYSELIDAQATSTAVLDAMEQHDRVHLACHAHQNDNDPTKSGFFLHDGTLDLATINRRSFRKKGLAFLSACQTATGDEALADEAVHLASGMLMAGYSSVIGTMWSVADADAPLVADKVYSQLMKTGTLGNGEAGRALHNAVAGLRSSVGEKEFGRWVPYIHIGS